MIKQVKVLVVDDSSLMRMTLKKVLEHDPRISVVATAGDGCQALEMIHKVRPDLVTMDIEMPVMDGLTALHQIMEESPLPVIMISALSEEGATATFKALELGAVDYISKNGDPLLSLNTPLGGFLLRQKVRAICLKNLNNLYKSSQKEESREVSNLNHHISLKSNLDPHATQKQIVAIGTSTGGPVALQKVITRLPANFGVPVLIVQHMPEIFIEPFAKRLDSLSQVTVKQSEHNETLRAGCVYVGKGGVQLGVRNAGNSHVKIVHDSDTLDSSFAPSVDHLMTSVAQSFQNCSLGVIMTGMGSDGLKGMKSLKAVGGMTLAQDEDSCVVYGMPKACVDSGIIDKIVPLSSISEEIIKIVA